MKILFITDAWPPQTNGVVRTLTQLIKQLDAMGHEVKVIAPHLFRTIPAPSYPEIRLALFPGKKLARELEAFQPDAIHLATEGPLGWAGQRYCVKHGLPFTTSYTTRFPEYLEKRWALPARWSYAVLRRFHAKAAGVMVATKTMRDELNQRRMGPIVAWSRGVDTEHFRPQTKDYLDFPRPIFLYVGRVAVEKNIEAFLDLKLPGSKVLIGQGPQLEQLKKRYPDAHFLGYRDNGHLASTYAAADVFVFPSRTDTFGLVQLEALASGVPVAAFPVTGPLDVIGDTGTGVLDEDLGKAALAALEISPERCRDYALTYSWRRVAELFLGNLAPLRPQTAGAPGTLAEAD